MPRLKKFIGLWIALIVFGIIVPGTFYLLNEWLNRMLGIPPIFTDPNNVFAASIALLVGLFWITWAYSYLHFIGKGSPVEAFGVALYPTQKLVTTGPYAYTRNPMMMGMLFVLLAIACLANSLSGLILVPILALLVVAYVRKFEEPGLVCRFGEKYIGYRKAVPTLIPKFKPYAGYSDR